MAQHESYDDFCTRIRTTFGDGCLPDDPVIFVDETERVNRRGEVLPYCGASAGWLLDDASRRAVAILCNRLTYPLIGTITQRQIPAHDLHVHLHALSHTPEVTQPALPDMYTQRHAFEILQRAPEELRKPIHMHSYRMANMASESIVLLLLPDTAEDYARMLGLYELLQHAEYLEYPAVPHITLAYFRPGAHDITAIRSVIDLPCADISFVLQPEQLMCQLFSTVMLHHYPLHPFKA